MLSSEEILARAAADGSIDISEWPRVLETVLKRLHDIVHNGFPLPPVPIPAPVSPGAIDPEVVASLPQPASDREAEGQDLSDAADNELPPNSQGSTKENNAPTDIASAPSVPSFEINHTPQPTQPRGSIPAEPGTLPPDLLSLYQTSTHVLARDFAHSPPYTIQRLAELVLSPKKHYRFLPAYLRALDRTVSVSSPISDFPLPSMSVTVNGGFLSNGDSNQANGITEREGLGSDESLGGALLTPIPWLRNAGSSASGNAGAGSQDGELHSERTETIEGPNGAGSIETVSVTVNGVPSATSSLSQSNSTPASPTLSDQSDASTSSSESIEAQLRREGGVTQGELLRQEQEAGVIPASQSKARRSLISGTAVAAGSDPAPTPNMASDLAMDERPPEETPHARGPDVIGMEDMGPQQKALGANGGLDMEAAVGRAKSPPSQQSSALPAHVGSPPRSEEAEQMAREAARDNAGAPAQDPQDVEKEVARLKEVMDHQKEEEAKDADGDVVVADVDGRPASEAEE